LLSIQAFKELNIYRGITLIELTIVEDSWRGDRNILKSSDVVEHCNPEALELRVIDDPADVDRLAGVADPRADSQGDVIWNNIKQNEARNNVTRELWHKRCSICQIE